MEKFRFTPNFNYIGIDANEPEYAFCTFSVKAEIDGKTYSTKTKEWWEDGKYDITDITNSCPHYAYVTDYGYYGYTITTFFDTDDYDDEDFVKKALKEFYEGYLEEYENIYIVDITTNEIIAEYHNTKNSRSIIIRNKEKCYLA